MNKKIFIFLFSVFLCLLLSLTSVAQSLPRLVDEADLLSSYEEQSLLSYLDEISVKHDMDIVVVTVNSLDGKTPMAYADDFYDYNGYKEDGVLLLISMEERDWYITTTGYGITALTDAGIDYISDEFLGDLSAGYYADAFMTYARLCDEFIVQANVGTPFDYGNMPKEPFQALPSLAISLAVGFVFALIVTGTMKSELNTVRRQARAENYIKNGSMNVTESRDMYLYRHVNRRIRPKETTSGGGSRTHVSSSGRSHGGGGGRF